MASGRTTHEQITATGIRIVGRAATELVAQAAAHHLQPPARGDLLWVGRFRARPRIGGGSAVPAILDTLTEQLRREWDACPALTREAPVHRPSDRYRGLSWDVLGDPGAWCGELVWRHRHPVIGGTPCTTHLILEEQHQVTSLMLSVAAEGGAVGVRGMVGAGQARPALLDALLAAVRLNSDGFSATPTVLADLEVAPFVQEVLLSETREWPVAVLAPLETDDFVVPPEALGRELFGLAPLFVLARQACTFRLTDAIGDRRLSAYFGALRVYRPEFSCADRSADHWLLLNDRLGDPLERLALIGQLGRFAVSRHAPIAGVEERRAAAARAAHPANDSTDTRRSREEPSPSEGPTPVAPETGTAPNAEIARTLATLEQAIAALGAELRSLPETLAQLAAANAQLADEVARLRTTTVIRASGNRAVERQLAAIEALLRPPPDEDETATEREEAGADEESRPTLVDVVRHAASEYGDGLLVLESAEKAAAESPYEDVDRVAAVLQAMAWVARRRQEGGLESGLRAAFQEVGIDYRAGIAKSTSARLRRQYQFAGPDGTVHDCQEHIALGDTYDPRRCLRIYFTSRAPSELRFVIGHIGRHLVNMTST